MKSCLRFEFDNPDVAGRFLDGILALPNMKGVTITIPGIPEEKYISELKIKPESCTHYSECPTRDKCVIPCIPECYDRNDKTTPEIKTTKAPCPHCSSPELDNGSHGVDPGCGAGLC